MSPIEKWGPATWSLIHTLSVSIKPDKIQIIGPEMFAFMEPPVEMHTLRELPAKDSVSGTQVLMPSSKVLATMVVNT